MPEQEAEPKQKKGFFERMSFFQKILIFVIAVTFLLLAASTIFGGFKNVYQFLFYLVVFVALGLGAYVVIKATGLIFKPRYFSPKEDLRTKTINMATVYKPDNLRDLYFTGDRGKKRVCAGKIIGCLGIPYFIGKIIRNKKGKVVYTHIKDYEGKKIPKYENIRVSPTGEGDTLFIVKKGWFIFSKTHYIRCHRDLHSTLNGDVEIYDINPQSYGWFEYPYKQMQRDVGRIMMQNHLEVIIATHEHQYDLISQGVDSAIYFNPYFQMELKRKAELGEE